MHRVPLGCDRLYDKVTRFIGAAKGDGQRTARFIHDPTRPILLLAAPIVLTGSVVATGETTTRKLAALHRRFPVHTQAFDSACGHGVVLFFFILSQLASVSLLFF